MAAMASIFIALWPGVLGAVATAILVYLSLRGLKWPAEGDGSTGQEAGAANQQPG
jgi:hypothetical protein